MGSGGWKAVLSRGNPHPHPLNHMCERIIECRAQREAGLLLLAGLGLLWGLMLNKEEKSASELLPLYIKLLKRKRPMLYLMIPVLCRRSCGAKEAAMARQPLMWFLPPNSSVSFRSLETGSHVITS